MSQPYIGQIITVGFNFAPINWALCNGQTLPISQFDTLYNLIGTTYGGDGVTNFALPDLRGRAPIHQGQGQGLSNYVLGQKAGVENVTLTGPQNASHNHGLAANAAVGGASNPTGSAVLAQAAASGDTIYSSAAPSAATLVSASISNTTGGGQPHENRQPLLVVNYCIALYGLYPPHS